MTSKTTLTIAALMAACTLSGTAEAGGVRLQFGGPLGSFVAHPHLSSGPGGTMRNQSYASEDSGREHCPPKHTFRRPAPKVEVAEEAPVRRVRKPAPKVVEVAEEAPAVRKVPKAPAPVRTAKLEDKTVATDATPAIFVPDSPPATNFTGTQSTPAPVRTAAIDPKDTAGQSGAATENKTEVVVLPVVDENAKTEPVKADKVEKAEVKSETTETTTTKLCRRFSAAIAGLIDVPCN